MGIQDPSRTERDSRMNLAKRLSCIIGPGLDLVPGSNEMTSLITDVVSLKRARLCLI